MHAVLVELELKVDPAQADEAIKFLRETVVPMISQGAGFVSGTWTRSADGTRTRSLILYADDAAAKAAGRAAEGPPPGAPTRFVSAEVFEVMAQA